VVESFMSDFPTGPHGAPAPPDSACLEFPICPVPGPPCPSQRSRQSCRGLSLSRGLAGFPLLTVASGGAPSLQTVRHLARGVFRSFPSGQRPDPAWPDCRCLPPSRPSARHLSLYPVFFLGLSQPRLSGPCLSPSRSSGPGLSQPGLSGPCLSPSRSSGPGLSKPRSSGPCLSPSRSSGPGLSKPRSSGPCLSPARSSGPGLSKPRSSGPCFSPSRTTGPFLCLSLSRPSGPRLSPSRSSGHGPCLSPSRPSGHGACLPRTRPSGRELSRYRTPVMDRARAVTPSSGGSPAPQRGQMP
jgi:hypothetical protein